MSWWTDIRDTFVNIVTAPIRIPAQFISDVFSGKNVFDSFAKAVLGGAVVSNPLLVGLSGANAIAPGAVKTVGAVIPGFAGTAQASQSIIKDGATKTSAEQLGVNFAKFSAVSAGGIVAGVPGVLGGKALASGDIKGALEAGIGASGLGDAIPSELVESARDAAEIARAVASRPPAAPVVNVAPSKSTTTALAPVVQGGPSPAQIAVIGGALVLGVVLSRRGKWS